MAKSPVGTAWRRHGTRMNPDEGKPDNTFADKREYQEFVKQEREDQGIPLDVDDELADIDDLAATFDPPEEDEEDYGPDSEDED